MDLATQEPVAAPAVEIPVEAPSIDQTIAEDWKKISGRDRDDQGRFKASEVSRETTAETPVEPVAAEVKPVEQATEDKPPSSWRKEAAAKWAELPAEIRAEALKREADFHKGSETYKTKAQFADEIQSVLTPYEQNFKQLGISPAYAIKTLFDTESTLRNGTPEQKAMLFHKLARDYNVDLNAANISNDPYVANLQQQVSNYEAMLQHQKYEQEMAQKSELTSTIEGFAQNHEHFESVRVHMGSLLSSGAAKDMQDAYDQACWANPTIRASLQAKQLEEERAKARQIAEEAKRKAAFNVNHTGTLPASKPIGTLDDTIKTEAQRLGLIH